MLDIDKLERRKDVKNLITALWHKDWDVRKQAVKALGNIGDSRAVEPLIKALGDNIERIRWRAARALGEIGDVRAVEPLAKALGDSDKVRRYATEALGRISDSRVVEPLIEALVDSKNQVRRYAAEALGRTGDLRAVEPLIKALEVDSNEYARRYAAEALGEIGDPRAVKSLINALADGGEFVRRYAVEALGRIGDLRAIEPLIKALEVDSNEYARRYVAKALGEIGDLSAVEPLIKALDENSSEYVRRYIVKALGEIGNPRAVETLIEILENGNRLVRWQAVKALGRIGDLRAFPALERATEDSDEYVRRLAEEALQKITKSDAKLDHKKPELHINIIADTGFKVGMWEKLHATVMNVGEGEAKDIKIRFSGPIEIGGVKTIPKLESGSKKETIIGIKPTEHGNVPLNVSISYTNEYGNVPLEINDVAYISVAKESETVSVQPQSIFNIGSIGEILGEGATKIGEGALVQRSKIGKGEEKEEKAFTKCPYCGEELNLPKTPKFCPYCGEQLSPKIEVRTSNEKTEQVPEIINFYKVERHLSELQKSILEMETSVWNDEKILPSLLRSGVFIIVGAWEGCEMFDRVIAYKIANELEKRRINGLVMTDRYWWEAKNKFGYEKSSVISVGGPISNRFSNDEIAERFGMEKYATAIGIREIEGQLVGYVWGTDARSTLNAGKIFIESHLDEFVRRLR